MAHTIGNPASWLAKQFGEAGQHLGGSVDQIRSRSTEVPEIRRLAMQDLKAALKLGLQDFAACRSDAMFIVFLYPLIGMAMVAAATSEQLFPLLVPMILGFAIVGPAAAVGLYEMSARREAGFQAKWSDALNVIRSPAFLPVLTLALFLAALFILWLVAANMIFLHTMGPETPDSLALFLRDVVMTPEGRLMAISGMAVGACFAFVGFATALISFPLLLDRRVGLPVAVVTSLRAVRGNLRVTFTWGFIVGFALVLGSIPFFAGLILVVPVLGHATWHLYRRLVV
ncbi:DUF2189 domain-containing protein [Epibacterium sp. SM1979]|uniref:DUF2189 domain-containing protein n=1 Tax=Tritonibacter litoralis TaxID=2662264 RepID=A0A843YP80_9RHOB|nr:DUF2189 domain-containing protein [Tritonibacter litoralis]MQQ10417.1 DUF2189 domain-containing protein [Tritonibacter litoralis]